MSSALGEDANTSQAKTIPILLVLGLILLLSSFAEAAERPKGLMWNRSGLAATLPLQIKTNSGTDVFLQLREITSGEPVLAAYVRGGEFFRVLVPPGRFDLLFVTGTKWQGETAQFGSSSNRIGLDPPLTFGATVSRKNGYLIDLRDLENISVRDLAICQSLTLDPELEPLLPRTPAENSSERFESKLSLLLHDHYRFHPQRYEVRSRVCE